MSGKKCQVILLKGSNIWKSMGYPKNMMTSDGEWFTNGKQIGRCINDQVDLQEHVLYITSDDEIEEGDWFISIPRETIHKCTSIFESNLIDNNWEGREGVEINRSDCKKVIATTDTLLIKKVKVVNHGRFKKAHDLINCLPQPSEHFIKKYVEEYNKGNVITEVMVDYEKEHIGTIDYSSIEELLKVNSVNQITISKVKDSWTREEVVSLIKNDLMNGIDIIYNGQSVNQEELDNWIEENL